jgi:hypothetical protein
MGATVSNPPPSWGWSRSWMAALYRGGGLPKDPSPMRAVFQTSCSWQDNFGR